MSDDDASRRVKLEQRVAELESIVATIPNFVVHFDHQLRVTFVNRYVQGLTPDLVVGRPIFDFIAPGSHQVARAVIEKVLRTGEPDSYQNEGPGPSGTLAVYQTNVVAAPGGEGKVGGCLVATDVTALARRESALAEGEEALQLALAASRFGLYSWNLETDVVTWDPRMHEITGLSEPARVPDYVERVVHPEDRAAVLEGASRATADGLISQKHRIVRPDGEVRWLITVGRVHRNAEGRPTRMVGGVLDITEQQQLEERLRHSQRLSAVGTLTAGVAHNFNNLLMVILPSLELLKPVVPGSHTQVLADSASAAERAAELVRKLMTYAGKRGGRMPVACDLSQLTERALSMCERSFDSRIALHCQVGPGASVAQADPADVEQVLMNLLLNARDAVVAAGGAAPRIDVEVGRSAEGDRCFLRVRDNGVGMDSETLRRACEPFFTTKGVGTGTGLGLATSSVVASELGGTLELESRPGHGTAVTLWLPASASAVRPSEAVAQEQARTSPRGVLVVDDEPLVRDTTARVLEHSGYRVCAAGDGEAALEAARQCSYDVVLLDRSLRGASGSALVPLLRSVLPRARIYFFTGHDVGPEESRLADGVLYKPVRTQDLLAAIEASDGD